MNLLMNNKVLVYNGAECTGCRYCELACSLKHHSQLNFNLSNMTIITEITFKKGEENTNLTFLGAHCVHCDPAPCQLVCPTGAILKEQNGRIFLNELRCIGCRSCTLACSLSVAWFDPEVHLSHKCDLCNGDPQCVDVCSVKAIKFLPRNEIREVLGDSL
ncbi:MAG: 4Fe-4S dicluster domain-containing protein [Candidatus Hodarchaeota archaeon]